MLVGDYDKSIVYGEKALDTYKPRITEKELIVYI